MEKMKKIVFWGIYGILAMFLFASCGNSATVSTDPPAALAYTDVYEPETTLQVEETTIQVEEESSILDEEVVSTEPQHKHKLEWKEMVAPSCGYEGVAALTCECGLTETMKPILPTYKHDFESYVMCGPCNNAWVVMVCKNCGKQEETYQNLGECQKIVVSAIPATCTQEGYIQYKCENCNECWVEPIPVDKNAHNAVRVENRDGKLVSVCAHCGEIIE